MKWFRIFCIGLFISFLGTLPLGTLNIAAMQLSVSDGIRPAIFFSLGALLVEIGYVRASLAGIDWIRRQKKLFLWLEWTTLVIVLALAIASFLAAGRTSGNKNVILSNGTPRFLLGMAMSAVNPMQIPFWFGWSTLLLSRKILQPRQSQYNAYVAGIGIGTLFGQLVFISGGRFLVEGIGTNLRLINGLIGTVFALTASIQLWKMIRKKDPITQL
jgi:threonine/homoserine/homoserine lactone efflux protein